MLDDVEESLVKEVDTENMLATVLGSGDQIAAVLAGASRIMVPEDLTHPSNVLVTGLGGSAIGGDYVAHWAERVASVPVLVNRTYDLPRWVGPDTLVVASSYSGNTEETLAAYAAAHKVGARRLALSTGGKIAEFAKRTGATTVPLPGGFQPRAALPTGFSTLALALEACKVLDARAEVEAALAAVQKITPDLGVDQSPARNEAKRLAVAMRDTTPVVYAADHLVPVARRFANQLNENSKVLAFWGVMPEMNHNELVAWDGDDDASRFTTIFLRHPGERDQVRARFDYSAKLIQERGGSVVQVHAVGESIVPQLLTTTLVTDVASVYLAALRKVDPTPVAPIQGLKAHVGKLGLAAELEARF